MITQPHPLNTGNSVASIEYSKLIWINRADVVENAYVFNKQDNFKLIPCRIQGKQKTIHRSS